MSPSASSRAGRGWWRPIVDRVDRTVTPAANSFVRTNLFADAVATMTRLEARVRRRMERQSTWLMHQYNMPTAGDIRKMRAQLAALEARMRDMAERLEDQQLEAERSRRPATPQRRSSGSRNAGKSTRRSSAKG